MATNGSRVILEFDPNVTHRVALAYPEGRVFNDKGGAERVMYSLADGRVMFLDPKIAAMVSGLHVKPREEFEIRKEKRGKAAAEWRVGKVGELVGAARPAPAAPAAATLPKGPLPNAADNGSALNGNTYGRAQTPVRFRAELLRELALDLADTYASALRVAGERHGAAVRADDVRAFVIASFQELCKQGKINLG